VLRTIERPEGRFNRGATGRGGGRVTEKESAYLAFEKSGGGVKTTSGLLDLDFLESHRSHPLTTPGRTFCGCSGWPRRALQPLERAIRVARYGQLRRARVYRHWGAWRPPTLSVHFHFRCLSFV